MFKRKWTGVPRWVDFYVQLLDKLDDWSPKSVNWFGWRWDFLDDRCSCVNCEERRAKGLQRPKVK